MFTRVENHTIILLTYIPESPAVNSTTLNSHLNKPPNSSDTEEKAQCFPRDTWFFFCSNPNASKLAMAASDTSWLHWETFAFSTARFSYRSSSDDSVSIFISG